MIELYPYIINDGIPSMKDTELIGLYHKMRKEGSLDLVFWTHSPNEYGVDQWLNFIKQAQLFLIMDNGKIAGACWLTNVIGRRADIHYCMFQEYWGKSDEICAQVPGLIFESTNLNVLMALIPESNERALHKPTRYGFALAHIIPQMCWVPRLNVSVAGYLYYITRENRTWVETKNPKAV
jgi:RimJ/RimL family protein N-acetyltransferase